jgi:hypothetical protein
MKQDGLDPKLDRSGKSGSVGREVAGDCRSYYATA